MKTHHFLITGTFAFALLYPVLPAKAFPFNKNCASLQAYMNSKRWNVPTKFSGFENYGYGAFWDDENKQFAMCDDGYITETSPMGTKICKGFISYNGGYSRWEGKGGCRWK